ncbi:unnamed protein product [Rotaria sp. Silwood2]|nr:unnamed protein product [Rotaria sp. Silwood2]CAF2746555.1 unnamed protein product [Rotaria sp. Silwood2]CAF2979651.1 unnamed protein product [Rotaria sp. Silwood2]CAF3332586.1 unnamed protein product [Rotaria sp. Silwood2]CAF4334254.1 unnamed protein product [Rotaria sp. Silwood2]
MVWICGQCKKGRHKSCENEWQCDCKCNIGGGADVTQKTLAIAGGTALAVGGLALTICTGGLGAVLIGGAMLGAGVSSTWNGAEKAIKGERIDGTTYVADVAFGAVTGVATGGVGAAGETIATNVVKQGAKEVAKAGAKKLAVRATTGIVTGVTAKAIDEVKQCSTTDKKWSDYGKSFDQYGSENGSVASWITSAAVGGLGGASSHVSSNLSKQVTSGVAKSVTRVAVSGTTAAVSDATIQSVNIAVGNQDKYDIKRTVTSASTSAIMTAAQEGTKNAIYKTNGGKDNMLHEKSNRKVIEEKVPKQNQQKVMKEYESLKKIPQATLNEESTKAFTYTNSEARKAHHQSIIDNYDAQITEQNKLKNAAIDAKNKPTIAEHQQKARNLIKQKNEEIKTFQESNKPIFQKSDIQKMNNDNNAHFLTGDKVGQIAVDIKSPVVDSRGSTRAIFDYGADRQGRAQFRYSDYTNEHDYSKMHGYGESNYYKTHQNYDNNLKVVNGQVNNLMCNQQAQDEKKRKKKQS